MHGGDGGEISRLEGAYEQVDRRLDDLNSRLGEMNRRLYEISRDMNSRFNAVIIFIGGSWVTMMAAIIGFAVSR